MSHTSTSTPSAPSSRYRRKLYKYYLKVVAQRGTPEKIAGGMALGLFVGLLIPMSVQLIIAIPLAFLFRLSAITAGIGTLITNPWSVIIIYPIQLYIGRWILTFQRPLWADVKATCAQFMQVAGNVKLTEWETYKPLFEMGWDELILPFFTAGALFGVIAAVLGYYFTKRLVLAYRAKSQERKRKRHQKIKSKYCSEENKK